MNKFYIIFYFILNSLAWGQTQVIPSLEASASSLTPAGSIPVVTSPGVLGPANGLTASITPTVTTLTVKAGAGQSSTNLQEWQNSSGGVTTKIDSTGNLTIGATLTSGYAAIGIIGNNAAVTPFISMGRSAQDALFGISSSGDSLVTGSTAGDFVVRSVGTAKAFVVGNDQASNNMFLTVKQNQASFASILGSGTWFTGGSATTTKPYLLIEPSGTTSTGWSTSGTGIGVNAASGFVGNLMDLQLNGVSRASIAQTGILTLIGGSTSSGTTIGPNIVMNNSAQLYWNTRSVFDSAVNGNIRVSNNAGTDFGLFQFGGTSSSFPALKRSTTGLIARLADDSADTWVQASQFRSTLTTPASAAATCTAGTIVADTGFIYVCTATDTWKRVAIATW